MHSASLPDRHKSERPSNLHQGIGALAPAISEIIITGEVCRHPLEKGIIAAERAEGPAMHDGSPVLPTVLANLVATTQGFGGPSRCVERLKANWALGLVLVAQKLQLFLETIEHSCHLAVVAFCDAHHVEHEPLAGLVLNAHCFVRVDRPQLALHIRG